MRPSFYPNKRPLQPNKEADETIRKLHQKDIDRYLEKIKIFAEKWRKECSELIHPETKPEAIKTSNLKQNNIDADRTTFIQNTVKKSGLSERTIQEDIEIIEQIKKMDRINSFNDDYSFDLSIFGFFMGGWIVYLFRPSNILGMQLSIQQIWEISNSEASTIFGGDDPLKSMAYTSIEYIITGAILGAVMGWVVGKFIKK